MKTSMLSILCIAFGVVSAEYVGPQNGNGNAYGVPTDSITPPQPQGGPYPPSGWKPAGPRLLLPGEARNAQQPNGNGFGHPPPSQYGPVNPAPSGPSIDNQYGPAPPNNQYIPGSGFGNGNGGNGNGGNGNGHNGNGHGGSNGGNGNGGSGSNGGNGGNGLTGGNGNGHNGENGLSNGNGHGSNGNNGHNGNENGGNGFTSPSDGNGFSNGNGNGGNAFGNGANGNGHNGSVNGNGKKKGNGSNGINGFSPAFHGGFPGIVYPYIQHSVPAVLAYRPGNSVGHGSIYPVYQVPISSSPTETGVLDPSLFSLSGAYPAFPSPLETSAVSAAHPGIVLSHHLAGTQPSVSGQGTGFIGHRLEPYFTFLTNHHSQKSQIGGLKTGLSNLQPQYAISQPTHGHLGVPVSLF